MLPVPETRASGASLQVARKEASGTAWLASRAITNRRPSRQVVMIVNTASPIISGNQPPLGILSPYGLPRRRIILDRMEDVTLILKAAFEGRPLSR
jgi:hypothetical protein